ncbi:hypothetical protein [Cyanothece sp. BG0011]|uniref:hypothetical protein n=1 Tax=Cyanothece sp. BG0011 TaxID=2082950 RepID=UPI000D1D9D26|nr:hypothetical protein [Cyanothece sp. BG0011]
MNLPDVESPSLKQVSETLGYHRRTLSRHFPDLCQGISAKYRQRLKTIQHETINKCCQEVRTVTYSLYADGKYPSESRVAEFLTHPSFLRYPQVREVFKQTKRDLGFEP